MTKREERELYRALGEYLLKPKTEPLKKEENDMTSIEPLTEIYLLNDVYYVVGIEINAHGSAHLHLEKYDELSCFQQEEISGKKQNREEEK